MNAPAPAPAGSMTEVTARLEALAAELAERGWPARLDTPAGQLPSLYARNPEAAALSEQHLRPAPHGRHLDILVALGRAHRRRPRRGRRRHRPRALPGGPVMTGPLDGPLAPLAALFPRFRIFEAVTSDRCRYVAQATDLGAHPHTVVTADMGELAEALSAGQQP